MTRLMQDVLTPGCEPVIGVGYSGQSTSAVRWNGTTWEPLAADNAYPSPNTNLAIANVLLAVARTGGTAWAVGYNYTGTDSGTEAGVQQTLIERYTC